MIGSRRRSLWGAVFLLALLAGLGARAFQTHSHEISHSTYDHHCVLCWVTGTPLDAPASADGYASIALPEAEGELPDLSVPVPAPRTLGPVSLRGPPSA